MTCVSDFSSDCLEVEFSVGVLECLWHMGEVVIVDLDCLFFMCVGQYGVCLCSLGHVTSYMLILELRELTHSLLLEVYNEHPLLV